MKQNAWKILVVLSLLFAVIGVITSKQTSKSTANNTPPVNASSNQASAGNQTTGMGANSAAKHLTQSGPTLIELGSKTCIPCKLMAPILEELTKENAGTLKVVFYDVLEKKEKAKEYGIKIIPTQVFFGKDGKEFFRHENFMPKADIIAKFKEQGIMLKGAK